MKYIVERTVRYEDGKTQTSYIINVTLFGVLFGPRYRAMVFDNEDTARKMIMQSRRSDREIYKVIFLPKDV